MRTKTRLAALLVAALAITGCEGGPATPPSAPPEKVDNVAVLVVDNFQKSPKLPQSGTENCAHTGLGTNRKGANEVGGTGAGEGLPKGVPHGKAVYDELQQELSNVLGQSQSVSPQDRSDFGLEGKHGQTGISNDFMAHWPYKQKNVLLLGVDTDGYTTDAINNRLTTLVDALSAKHKSVFQRIVVNLSFVLAPCNVDKWFAQYGYDTQSKAWFDGYRAIVKGEPDLEWLKPKVDSYELAPKPMILVEADTDFAPVVQRLNIDRFYSAFIEDPKSDKLTAVDLKAAADDANVEVKDAKPKTLAGKAFRQIALDPMFDRSKGFLHSPSPNPVRKIVVGAAGNGIVLPSPDGTQGLHFNFPFPFAPAMSGDVISVSAPAAYSNSGEVKMPGDFQLTVGSSTYNLEGTSFSAPRMAAKQAIYLLTGGEVPCGSDTPPLGYATDARANSPDWQQNWRNYAFTDPDLQRMCPIFLTRTTLQNP